MSAIYWAFDADEEIIYIGCSSRLGTRLALHESKTSWWDEVERIEIERFDVTRHRLLELEADRIAEYAPKYNTAHVPKIKATDAGSATVGRPRGWTMEPAPFVEYRDRRGITSSRLARELGLAPSTVSLLISGNGRASVETAAKISRHIGVELAVLFPEASPTITSQAA